MQTGRGTWASTCDQTCEDVARVTPRSPCGATAAGDGGGGGFDFSSLRLVFGGGGTTTKAGLWSLPDAVLACSRRIP